MEIQWGKKHHNAKLELAEYYSPDVLAARRKLVPILKELRDLKYDDVHIKQDRLYVGGTVCEEERWTKLLKEPNNQNVVNVSAQENKTDGIRSKRKTESNSPEGNTVRKPQTPTLTMPSTSLQSDLCPQKSDNAREYLKFNQKPPSSPITKYLSQKIVAETADLPKNKQSELNKTIK